MRLIDTIRAGDTVTILTPQNSKLKGRAVMKNLQYDSWVLNGGGRHGTPLIADDSNVVKVTKSR